jgi:GDP-L-fucose synthase
MGLKISDRIFVAGHKGMVGSSILRLLKKKGYKNLITVSKKKLNLENQSQVNNFFKKNKIDFIFLCAAKVGGIYANDNLPAEFILKNILIQTNIINAAHKNKINKLIFLGSSCIYPRQDFRKIREIDILTGKLEMTNEPYAVAKISGIKMCESFNRQYNTDYRSLMPTNMFGPGDNYHKLNSHVMAALIRKFIIAYRKKHKSVVVWGSGKPKREFLYIDDFASASIYLAKMSKRKYHSFVPERLNLVNIGYGKDFTIKHIAELIKKYVGYKGKIVFDKTKKDGVQKKLLDNRLIRKLGWKPKEKFETALKNYIVNIRDKIIFD